MNEPTKPRGSDQFTDKVFLGKGSFGQVYKAFDTVLKKAVALKEVDLEKAEQDMENLKFVMGIKIEYIVSILDHFIQDNKLYIVMECCDGGNLRSIIANKEEQTEETIKDWTLQLMCALIYMQTKKVFHNDIKPESIVIVDLGEAQLINKCKTLSKRGGTKNYMSPERAVGEQASVESETWSCGVVIYEVIHFKLPFENLSDFLQGATIEYSRTPVGLFFERILEGILEKDVKLRFRPEKILEMVNPRDQKLVNHFQTKQVPRNDEKKRILNKFSKEATRNYIEIIDLNMIDNSFKNENIVLLYGIPGAGKSTLASVYANKFSEKTKDSIVVWINSDDQSKIDLSIRSILIDDLKVKENEFDCMNNEKRLGSVAKHIQESMSPHLFIFDNIEEGQMHNIESLVYSMPSLSTFKIILTSRNKDINKNHNLKMNSFELRTLDADQVKSYYFNRVSRTNLSKNKVEIIFEKALANRQSMSPYLLNKVVETLELFVEDNGGLQDNDLNQLTQLLLNVDITEKMLGMLRNQLECREILEMLTFLDQDEIAIKLIDRLGTNKNNNRKALQILKKHSLISSSMINDLECIRLHRLTSASLLKLLKDNEEKYIETKRRIMRRFTEVLEDRSISYKAKVSLVYTHLVKLYLFASSDDLEEINFVENLIRINMVFYNDRHNSIKLKQNKIEHLKRFYQQEENKDIANNSCEFLYLSKDEDGFKETLRERCEQVKQMVMTAYADDKDLNYAKDLMILSKIFKMLGENEKSLSLLNESEETFEKFYLKDQPDQVYAEVLRAKIFLLKDLNRKYNALEFVQKSAEVYKTINDKEPDNERYAESLYQLSRWIIPLQYGDDGLGLCIKRYELIKTYIRLNSDEQNVHAIAGHLSGIADLFYYFKKPDEAVEVYQLSIVYFMKTYFKGEDVYAMDCIARTVNAFKDLKRIPDAIEMLKIIVKRYESFYKVASRQFDEDGYDVFRKGAESFEVLAGSMCLIIMLRKLSRHPNSLSLFDNWAQVIRRYVRLSESESVLDRDMVSLISFFVKIRRPEESFSILTKWVQLMRNHYAINKNDNFLVIELTAVAEAFTRIKKYQNALELNQEAASIHARNPDHDICFITFQIAKSQENLNMNEQAIESYSKAGEILIAKERKRKLEYCERKLLNWVLDYDGENYHAQQLKIVADSLANLKAADKAFVVYKEVAKIYKDYWENHLEMNIDRLLICDELITIAKSLRDLNRPTETLEYYREAVFLIEEYIKYSEKCENNIDHGIKRVFSIACAFEELNEANDAIKLYKSTLSFIFANIEMLKNQWYGRNIEETLVSIGEKLQKLGQLKDAYDIFQKTENLLSKSDMNGLTEERVVSLLRIAKAMKDSNSTSKSTSILKYCIGTNIQYHELAQKDILCYLGYIKQLTLIVQSMKDLEKPEEAVPSLRVAVDLVTNFSYSLEDREYLWDLASQLKKIVDILNELNEHDQAVELDSKAEEWYQEYYKVDENKQQLIASIQQITAKLNELNMTEESFQFGKESTEIMKIYNETHRNDEDCYPICLMNIVQTILKFSLLEEAFKLTQTAAKFHGLESIEALTKLARTFKDLNKPKEAYEINQEAANFMKEFHFDIEYLSVKDMEKRVDVLESIAHLMNDLNKVEQTIDLFKEAADLIILFMRETKTESDDNQVDKFIQKIKFLADSLRNLNQIEDSDYLIEEAENLLDE